VGFSSITHPSLLRFGAAHSRVYRFPKTFSQIAASSPTFLIESKTRIRYSHLHRGIMSRCFTLMAYIMFSKVRLHPKTMSHVATQILRRRSPRANYSSSTSAMLRNFEEREVLCVCVCVKHYTGCLLIDILRHISTIKDWIFFNQILKDKSLGTGRFELYDHKDEFFRKCTMW